MYGPRASQVAATLAELAERGWQPSVVCLDPRRGGPHWPDGTDAAVPAGVEMIRVPSPQESLAWRAAASLIPIIRKMPDDQRLWVARAAVAVRASLARQSVAGMITFGQPWSDHLVGVAVRRSNRIPWVAHFSDPWVDSPYLSAPDWLRRRWARMECAVIAQADAVVFVTEETADLVMGKYPEAWGGKVAVVPHGFVPRTSSSAAAPAVPRRDGPLRLVYTGRFYRGVREPLALFRAIAELHAAEPLDRTLEVVFMGPHVQEFQRDVTALGIAGIVRVCGRRPKAEADRLAADADVLLVIDAPSERASVFLPSKLVDYLAFAKPLLGLTPAAGATARLLERLGCPVVQPDDVAAIRAAIATLIERWRNGRLALAPAFHDVAGEYDIRRTTARLDAILVRAFRLAA